MHCSGYGTVEISRAALLLSELLPVAPMCLDPMQHSHILDNSYLAIEFHNWCGYAPMHGAQQVQLLMGCLCWCLVAPMCLDPLQHSPIFDNSYLVIDFHNWCGEAPMYGAQQVQLLMGCLCWCPAAPMCPDPLQAAACIYIHAQTGLYIHIRVGFHCAQHDS